MSNYEAEAGTYTLPAGEYNRLKREFKAFWDAAMIETYDGAVRFYEYAQTAGKNADTDRLREDRRLKGGLADLARWRLLKKGKNGRWMKPKKADLNTLKANAMFKRGGTFEMDEACVSFDDERRAVRWVVSENNHAVRDARETRLADFFFRFLRTVKWRGRTGGSIAYENEYMREHGPCEPSYVDLYGYALKNEEERIKAILKGVRRRRK